MGAPPACPPARDRLDVYPGLPGHSFGKRAGVERPSTPDAGTYFVSNPNLISYAPATGTGDSSFTEYKGGKCKGATFDSTGATVADTGTLHFTVCQDGDR